MESLNRVSLNGASAYFSFFFFAGETIMHKNCHCGARMRNKTHFQKNGKVLTVGVLLLFFLLKPALAEKYQFSLFGGINHVFTYGSEEDYVLGENDFPAAPAHTPADLGASFALYLNDKVALELDGRFTLSSKLTLVDPYDDDTVTIDSSRHYSVTLNFLYRFLEGSVRPYFIVGGGIDKLLAEDKTYTTEYGFEVEFLAPEKTIDPVANLGGGAYFLVSPNIGIRFDLRYMMIFSEPDTIRSLNGVLGICFLF